MKGEKVSTKIYYFKMVSAISKLVKFQERNHYQLIIVILSSNFCCALCESPATIIISYIEQSIPDEKIDMKTSFSQTKQNITIIELSCKQN